MTEPIRPVETDAAGARIPLLAAGIALGLMFLCVLSPSAAEQLLLGWFYFPARVLPLVTVDPPTLLLGLFSTCVAIAIMHGLLRWFVRTRTVQTQHWAMRGTVIVTALLLLLFVAGTAMVGATHQTVWLITRGSDRGDRSNQTAPVFGAVELMKESAARGRYSNGFRHIATGLIGFHDVHDRFPFGGAMDDHGGQLHGWIVLLGPYMIYSNEDVDFTRAWNSAPNDRVFRCALPEVLHPSIPEVFDDEGYGLSHVAGNVHVLPIITVPRGQSVEPHDLFGRGGDDGPPAARGLATLGDISDGAANTILAGEVVENFRPWGHPGNVRDPALGVNQSPDGFGCLASESGVLFLMCDGSFRGVSPDVDDAVLRALATPAGGEPIGVEF